MVRPVDAEIFSLQITHSTMSVVVMPVDVMLVDVMLVDVMLVDVMSIMLIVSEGASSFFANQRKKLLKVDILTSDGLFE